MEKRYHNQESSAGSLVLHFPLTIAYRASASRYCRRTSHDLWARLSVSEFGPFVV